MQIVDCDTTCYGCNGGWPYLAYQYVIKVWPPLPPLHLLIRVSRSA